MEVIEISGYTPREKLHIAKRYLVPQELDAAGLGSVDVKLGDQTIFHIMNGYTRESGVRQLRRSVGAVLRKISRAVATGGKAPHFVSPKMAQKFLGPVLFVPERRLRIDEVGVVAGLAWTEVGGEILLVEVAITKGKGQLSLTGQLGDVMRESAMAALTYVLSRAVELGIDAGFYESSQVHLHVPQGAIPKDGPSAGIAIATALVSVLTGRPVRKNVAMTGEITLRGNVLPIGGLKEKALAALRAGMDTVIIPKENERELVEFPRYLREEIRFVSVEAIDEVFALAMLPKTDSPTVEHKTLVRKPRMRGPKTSRRANT
jgi:ATP-dependent Lon protease